MLWRLYFHLHEYTVYRQKINFGLKIKSPLSEYLVSRHIMAECSNFTYCDQSNHVFYTYYLSLTLITCN
ncbi:unnamed protein product [Rhizophagus irregularis]|nr:unnamed protein product [Rhizophagus irregularis]